ncbi:dTDP-4-dehydrorhamnose 3,5-epimerase [Macellibacteroides fermentans]|jgi:dTDP-4-dehydrorhamnose 3,5-epimerase|uniref:dTDP-4-dehydrorhamnose 3,5-epimerase n=2 Tax=Bacteroidales TaxID=171549 RepID=A0A1T5BL17_9BACT|nr:dTDP-4-dehydrorhamnose 3,5-epimerase [Parabacteroides chartae]
MLAKMIYFVFYYREYRMKYIQTEIAGLWIIEPKVLSDSRGYFMESFKQEVFNQNVGKVDFIQENESGSSRGVLRGLHYQLAPYSQAKLVRVIEGTVLDVAVDLRKGSPTFGKYMAVELSGQNKRQFYIPQGFAHGFHVLSERAVFTYKVDNPYMPSHERSLRFDDPQIGIDWQITDPENVILSEKDKNAPLLAEADINYIY